MAEEGFLAFVQEKRAQLPPGAEEPDWEDEWDDLTLAQKAPYVEKTTAHPAPSPPKAKPAASSPRPAPAASSPRPAPVASTSKAASSSSGAGPSGSKPASLESQSGKTKRPKSGVRKPRSAFELFASQQRKTSRNDDADDEAPDLGQMSEERLRGVILELEDGADLDEYQTRGELLAYCGQLLSVVGPSKWRKAEQKLEHREQWKRLSQQEQQEFEKEAGKEREAYDKAKLEGGDKGAPAKPAAAADKPQAGAKRKGAPTDVKPGETWEETCPEFGEGWIRRSRQREDRVDHTFISPAGKMFNSRIKVAQHLGLPAVPEPKGGRRLNAEEVGERERSKAQKVNEKQREKEQKQKQKEKEKEKEKARKQQAKGAKGQAKERLASALKQAGENENKAKAAKEEAEPAGPPPPEPPGTLPLKNMALAHDFMAVWAFAGSFARTLLLQPFSPEELAMAMQRPGESVLLGELHARLLRTLLVEYERLRKTQSPAPLDLALLLQQVPPASAVSSANWPEVLRNLRCILPDLFTSLERGGSVDLCAEALARLQSCDYVELGLEQKLVVLRVLMDVVNACDLMHEKTNENEKMQQQLLKQRKEFETNLKKELEATRKEREEEAKQQRAKEAVGAPPPAEAKKNVGAEGQKRRMATSALLDAIKANDKEDLLEAIDDAVDVGLEGRLPDGRPWATDELKAGRKRLQEFDEQEIRKEEDERMGKKLAKQLRKHVERMHEASVREEPLGEDRRGRRFWFFNNDANRLWVEAPKGQTVERENGSTWAWAYYDTAAHVALLIDSLDGRGQGCEARLKRALKELQPVLNSTMVKDMAQNDGEDWLESGHEWLGQAVLRIFPSVGPSPGKITKWLPQDEEAGDGALFHVVHDADGDEEDLEEEEARVAIEQYKEQADAGGGAVDGALEQPKYCNMWEQKKLRVLPHQLGVAGLRAELLDLEEALREGLRKARSKWDSHDGDRQFWLTSCRDTDSLHELASLLQTLEEAVKKMQTGLDVAERPPWRTEASAHEYIGVYARRFFEGFGASDGKIVGYLPPEGDDGALWHMVHGDDKDEEDLDEREVQFAIQNYRDDLKGMGEEERAYLAEYRASLKTGEAEPMDEEEEGEEEEEEEPMAVEDDEDAWMPDHAAPRRGATRSGLARGAETHVPPSKVELRAAGLRPRLWNSRECRERWTAALKPARSVASVSFALHVFRQHCQAFGIYTEQKGQPRLKRAALDTAIRCYYHPGAFGIEKKPGGKHGKKK